MNKEIDTKIDALNAKIDATLRQIAGFTHDADAILCLTEDTLEDDPVAEAISRAYSKIDHSWDQLNTAYNLLTAAKKRNAQ